LKLQLFLFAHLDETLMLVVQAHPKSNALATALTKRKSPDRGTGALLVPGSKKQKSTTCMVCCITANSKKAMQDHLNGKAHKRKVVALPELPKLVPETEQERGLEAGEEEAMAMETLGDYKPKKFMMATNAGELNEVAQMDGYLLCELCNVPTADRVTMMCHLQGSKHISNCQKKRQPSIKPSNEAKGTVSAATSAIGSADPKKLALEDFSVPLPHTVRRLEGFLLCELCDVKVPSMHVMRQHLSGKKHKNKVNTSSDAFVLSTGGKEAVKVQPVDTQTFVISDLAAKVEAPLEKSLQPKLGDDSELQETTVTPAKEDAATGDSAKTAGKEMMKSSATFAGAQPNNVSVSNSLTMEVDSVMHPLSQVDGFLVCLSCNIKLPSETIMKSHLAGKKHKRKMALAARGNSDLSVLATGADEVQDSISKTTKANVEAGLVPSVVPQANTTADEEEESAPLLATPQTENTVAMALTSMAVDLPAEAQLATCIVEPAKDCEITKEAEGEHAALAPGKPIKIQVEGKVFTVMRQENGSLLCEVCGVVCDKDSMILHLYTSAHWSKASLAEEKEKEQACITADAVVDKDGEVGNMANKGSGGLRREVAVGVCDRKQLERCMLTSTTT
jgi:hypothetical protein